MQIQFAGTGIRLSDGPTTMLPIPQHRRESLSPTKSLENRRAVHRAWKLHYRGITHALDNGIYQGWDLRPAQLPVRFAAIYIAFFLDGLDAAPVYETSSRRRLKRRALAAFLTRRLQDRGC